ncbi:MAG: class A beta-lactamase-related serine hydrolase [Acidobacteria bacterium]|nr:MAG: class A beta-lactamase-related serine hydrolase [Acidobacteriota bacterium]
MLLRNPRRSASVLVAFAFATSLAVAAPCPSPSAAARAKIDAVVPQLMAKAHVPGVALGVACNGRMVFAQGYGFRNLAQHLPVAPETRFQIGSITKQFTAAAILQLRAAGKLSLDDHVARFLPHFPHASQITLRELLNQTTGLYNYTEAPHFVATADHSRGGFIPITALVAPHPLAFAPGTKWQYSNTNYIVLGQIVAAASGESYAAYMQTHIFSPAGMTATRLIGRPLPDTAEGYNVVSGKVVPAPPLPEAWAGSAGAIVSTVGDLERWDQAVSDGKLISKADYKQMTSAGVLTNGQHDTYGFGWMLGQYGSQPTVWHNGGTFGFLALNARLPQSGLDIIVLTNSTALPPWNIAHAVLRVLMPLPSPKSTKGADPAFGG